MSCLWTSDEAHCYLDPQINSKNNIFWGSSKPDVVVHRPLHSKKVTVWCALSAKGIIGPFFFEENEKAVSINTERYIQVLKKFIDELKTRFPASWKRYWFQKDGASPHTSGESIEWLKKTFGKKLVSNKTEISWQNICQQPQDAGRTEEQH